jgi:hypothetical protein
LYIPNLIVLAFHLGDSLANAIKRHESWFVLSCAALSWLTLELMTPLGPVWGDRLPAYPQGFAIVWGTLLVLFLTFSVTAILNHIRYVGEAYLVSLTTYCFLMGLTTGSEYTLFCAISMLVASAIGYIVVMKFIDVAYNGATE